MGTNSSQSDIVYNVPIEGSKQKGFSPIYRNPKSLKALKSKPIANVTTMKDIVYNSLNKYKNKDFIGQIHLKTVKEGQSISQVRDLTKYTFGQVVQMSEKIGTFILKNKLELIQKEQGMKVIGIFSKNRYEWAVAEITSCLYGLTLIPLYQTLGMENLTYCLQQSGVSSLFVTNQTVNSILKLKGHGNLQNIVSFDKLSSEAEKQLLALKLKIFYFEQALKQTNIIDHKSIKVQPKNCHIFSYTSGTTGPPKGAMISHSNMLSLIGAFQSNEDLNFNQNDSHVSFLPLPHLMERSILTLFIFCGGFMAFYAGDLLKIKDDIVFIKPTILFGVPRIYNRIVEATQKAFQQSKEGIKGCIISSGVTSKLQNLHKNGQYDSMLYDYLIFSKVKQKFGGRIRLMVSGSAPLKKEVFQFMKILMSCPFLQAYGQTQNTAGATITSARDLNSGHVGGLAEQLQMKLCDVEEMNYTSQDKDQNGKPSPRGQIWLRGPGVFMGYYKDKQKTDQAITPDGWLKTGDIGMILPGFNNALKIIDRKKNIFKLQQGEYVASQKVQAVYSRSYLISESFLFGQSTQNFAVAIVVPQKDELIKLAQKHQIEGSFEQLCKNKNLKMIFCKQMDSIGKKQGLMSFEQAKNIWLEPESFANKNIISSTMKLQRFAAKKCYEKQIETMYNEGPLLQK